MAEFEDAIERVSTTVSVPGSSSTTVSVSAPAGKKVIGGGAEAPSGLVAVNYSYPSSDLSEWKALVVNNQPTAQDVNVHAVCFG